MRGEVRNGQVGEGAGVSHVGGDRGAALAFVEREAVPRVGVLERVAGRGTGCKGGSHRVVLSAADGRPVRALTCRHLRAGAH